MTRTLEVADLLEGRASRPTMRTVALVAASRMVLIALVVVVAGGLFTVSETLDRAAADQDIGASPRILSVPRPAVEPDGHASGTGRRTGAEVLAAIAEVGLVLFGIVDFDDGVEDVLFLALGGFAENLLG
jgi:hypothetical protein